MLHFKFQTSLALTHSAFLKGQGLNQFNSIEIYSRNKIILIMTGARRTHHKKARPDGWDTLKGISSNDNIITKRKYWVKLKN